jgi:hypothetical protein
LESLKTKLHFLVGFVLAGLSLAFFFNLTNLKLADQITGYYQEIQDKQERAFLGDFNEGRSRREMDLEQYNNLKNDEKTVDKKDGQIIKGNILKKDPVPFEEEKEIPLKKTDYVFLTTLLVIASTSILVWIRARRENGDRTVEIGINKEIKNDSGNSLAEHINTDNQNKIRHLLIDWQTNLKDDQKKRDSETIYDWFLRINGPMDIIPIYEKVRYGCQKFTQHEYLLIYSSLKQGRGQDL